MYQAKRKGGGRHQIVDLREQHRAAQRRPGARPARAPERGELRTEYQPIVTTGDGRVAGSRPCCAGTTRPAGR